jgi:uncharacterized membrane protein
MQTQNFKNHARLVPLYHFVTFTLLVVILIGSIVNLSNSARENIYSASLLVALTIAVILIAFFARTFALKAQDRAIRAEENFRHFIATGQPLDNRLRMSQVIALRFAGDDEFVALAKKAASENMRAKEIKKAIQNWKGDYHRA